MVSLRARSKALNAAWEYSVRLASLSKESSLFFDTRRCLQHGDVVGARHMFEEEIQRDPNTIELYVAAASMERRLRSLNESREFLNRALSMLPQPTNSTRSEQASLLLRLRAIIDFEGGNDGAAKAAFKLLKKDSGSVEQQIALALTEAAMEDSESALRKALTMEGVSESVVHRALSERLMNSCPRQPEKKVECLGEVINLCEKGITLNPDDSILWTCLASAHESNGDIESARSVLRCAESLGTLSKKALFDWSLLEQRAGNLDAARTLVMRCLPRLDAVLQLCKLDHSTGKKDAALDRLRSLLESVPSCVPAYLLYAHFEMESPERSIKILQTGLERCDRQICAPLFNMIATIEKKQGRLQAARYALGSALRAQPGHVQSAHQLARLDLESGRFQAAQRCIHEALKKDPHNPRLQIVQNQIDNELQLSKSPEQRLAHQRMVVDGEPLNGIFVRDLMKKLTETHNHKEALELGLSKLEEDKLRFRSQVVVETAYILSKRSFEGSLELLKAEISTFRNHGSTIPPHNLVMMKTSYARIASRPGQPKEIYHRAISMLEGHEQWNRPADVQKAKQALAVLNSRIRFRHEYQPNLFRY